jgi:hypothetical protein
MISSRIDDPGSFEVDEQRRAAALHEVARGVGDRLTTLVVDVSGGPDETDPVR